MSPLLNIPLNVYFKLWVIAQKIAGKKIHPANVNKRDMIADHDHHVEPRVEFVYKQQNGKRLV